MLSNVPIYFLYCTYLVFMCHAIRREEGSWSTYIDNVRFLFFTTMSILENYFYDIICYIAGL